MPDAEFVQHVRIAGGQVGNGVLAHQQPLEHGLVDDSAELFLVGSDRSHAGLLDARFDGGGIDPVEVDVRSAARVRLRPEGHEHEAQWLVGHPSP